MDQATKELSAIAATTVGTVLIIAASIVFLLTSHSFGTESIVLSAIAGIVLLTISLAGLIVVAKALGVATTQEALGLPAGSIRALLAFTLIIVFLAVSSWVLGSSNSRPITPIVQTAALPVAAIATERGNLQTAFPAPQYVVVAIDAGPQQNRLQVYDRGGDAQLHDLQKQIITILATVLVSVISFYFAGKSASDAMASTNQTLRQMSDALTVKPDAPPGNRAPPASEDHVQTQIAALAEAGQKLIDDFGADPLGALRHAIAGSTDPTLHTHYAEAEKAFANLGTAVAAMKAERDKAQATQRAVPPADPTGSAPTAGTDLAAILKHASDAKQAADAAARAFAAARDAIMAATAQG